MIESANFQNGQSSNNQIHNSITKSPEDQLSKQSTNNNQHNYEYQINQPTNKQINEDIKPSIKEIMGKISIDLEKTKNTNGKIKQEANQFIALDFQEGSCSSKKDEGNQQINGFEQVRKSSAESQRSQTSKNKQKETDDENVKKNKIGFITNERKRSDLNEEEMTQEKELEAKSEESKTPEKSARNTDIKYSNTKGDNNNNNSIESKSDILQEKDQKKYKQLDFKQVPINQDSLNTQNSQLNSYYPQNNIQSNSMNNQNIPQNQQSATPIRQPLLSQQYQPQERSSQQQQGQQQQQQQQQPYQQQQPSTSELPPQKLGNFQKNQPSLQVKSNKNQSINPPQDSSQTNPSSFNSNKQPSKASLTAINPSKTTDNNHQASQNQQIGNNPQQCQETELTDSKNLYDSRVSSTQNMTAKLQFLEQENEMLNKENALLRLKNEFLNNRLNEVHRQNSNFSSNSSFNNNNNSSQNMFKNSNQQQSSSRQTNQPFTHQQPSLNNEQPYSQFESKDYLNSANKNNGQSFQQQQQQQSPMLRTQTINDQQNSSPNDNYQLNNSNILASLCQLLQVNQPTQLIPAVQTYQKCIQKIPKLESFIQNVYTIVLPSGVFNEQLVSRATMGEVINQIQAWKNQHIQSQYNINQQKFYLELFNADSSKQLDPFNLLLTIHSKLDEFNIFQKNLKETLQIDPSTRTDLAFKMALDKLQQYSSSRWFTKELRRITGITDIAQLFQEIEKSLILKSRVTHSMNANITLGRFE